MSSRLRAWAEERFAEYVGDGIAVRLRDLDPLTFIATCLARPRGLRYLVRWEWRMATVLPGDRFVDFQRDEDYEVLVVKRDHVIAWTIQSGDVAHGGTVKAWRPSRPPRVFYRGSERCMSGWSPA
jgi:hypothetical protein